jgi:2'-5' RNA ligase
MPVATDALPEIEEHLRTVAATFEPFDVRLRGSATFLPVSPVVFVPLVVGIAECEQLYRAVRSGPLERSVAYPFHPHVTVAHNLPAEALHRAYQELSSYEAQFRVWGLTLFEQGPDQHWRPPRDVIFGGGGLPGPAEERYAGHDGGW